MNDVVKEILNKKIKTDTYEGVKKYTQVLNKLGSDNDVMKTCTLYQITIEEYIDQVISSEAL